MIRTFKDKLTEAVFAGKLVKGFPETVFKRTRNKLLMLDAAAVLDDLRSPPGNRLEVLVGDREGQHSLRINEQFRLCFRWTDAGPVDVEFTDWQAWRPSDLSTLALFCVRNSSNRSD